MYYKSNSFNWDCINYDVVLHVLYYKFCICMYVNFVEIFMI